MIITAISPAINRIRFRFFLSSVPFLSSNLFIRSFLSSALVLPMIKSYTASPFYRLAVMSCISVYGPVERLSNRRNTLLLSKANVRLGKMTINLNLRWRMMIRLLHLQTEKQPKHQKPKFLPEKSVGDSFFNFIRSNHTHHECPQYFHSCSYW